jgi:cytochrome c-type biogenesis protein
MHLDGWRLWAARAITLAAIAGAIVAIQATIAPARKASPSPSQSSSTGAATDSSGSPDSSGRPTSASRGPTAPEIREIAAWINSEPLTLEQLRGSRASILNTLLFVAGFSSVFVLLGGSLGVLSASLQGNAIWLNRVGGALVIAFGLMTLGLFRVRALERGLTLNTGWAKRFRYIGSLLVGGAFAVGWVPCVGPILGAILVLAGTGGSAAAGAILLFAYSLGLMLPFFAAGVFSGWTRSLLSRHGRALTVMNYAGGAGLVVLGVVVYTNLISTLANYVPVTL